MQLWSLTEVSDILGEPQHRLIYLCEQGTIVPVSQQGEGRGSSRKFSGLNLFEFALALRFRDVHMPSSAAAFVIRVLNDFSRELALSMPGFALPEAIAGKAAPDFRVIISDGRRLFFTFGAGAKPPKLFGGIDMQFDADGPDHAGADIVEMPAARLVRPRKDAVQFGGPERSEFGRTEVSLTKIAQQLVESKGYKQGA